MMPSTAVVRFDLSAPFSEFDEMVNRQGYIGPKVLRPRSVAQQSANISLLPIEVMLQEKKTKRAPGGGYQRGDFEFDVKSYQTTGHGWEEVIDDETLALYRDLIDAEAVHSRRAINFVLSEYERDVAAAVFNTTTWTGASLTTGVGTAWSVVASSAPIDNVNAAREKVITSGGMEPNALVLNRFDWRNLINSAQIVDRVKYTKTADQSTIANQVAAALDIEQIIVAGGLTNTANDQKDAVIARIWGSGKAMLCRVAQSDDPAEPCIGRTYMWSGDGPGAAGTGEELAYIVEEYREEKVRGAVLRARNNYGITILRKELGHLLTGL